MQCDMCGKGFDTLNVTKIEGVEMSVCKECSKYGKFVKRIQPEIKIKQSARREVKIAPRRETAFAVHEEYGNRIKNAREKLNLKQEDLANKLNEKASLMQRIESGHKEPSIDMARKLEKFLRIKLIETQEVGEAYEQGNAPRRGAALTIGDMIKMIQK